MIGRIVCFDYGDSRIGVAMTDPLRIIVSAYKTIQNTSNAVEELSAICVEKEAAELVIGMPYGKESEIGIAAKKVISFAILVRDNLIKKDTDIKIYYQDERYTTRIASDTMRFIGVKNKRKKALVDQIAACSILQSFIDSRYKEEAFYTVEDKCD